MKRKIHLCLLIFCCLLSPGIGYFQEDIIEKSVDLHIRKKRIIDRSLNGNKPVSLRKVWFMVQIVENGDHQCGGNILSPTVIITAAHCVFNNAEYTVLSGSVSVDRGLSHNVTEKIIHRDFHMNFYSNDIALLKIFRPINFLTSHNRDIPLFNEILPRNAMGTISGWGCREIRRGKRLFPNQLRSITVRIISLEVCQEFYQNLTQISNLDICTLDDNREKGCSYGDSGGPLVVNGKLLGIFAFKEASTETKFPDVFVNLMYPPYKTWINSFIFHSD